MAGAQNTWRMDPGRSGGVCRHFINGSCRFGPRCNYRHEWPVCRYFQKGGCWYGESCRYLHVLQPEAAAAVIRRRGSAPNVSSPRAARTPPDRGSQPATRQVTVRQECNRSETVVDSSDTRQNIVRLASDTEEQSHVQGPVLAQADACDQNKQTSSADTTEVGAAAAASSTLGKVEEMEAFLQSKDVTCGICMDKVYEKADPRNNVFGILPNCNHSFCLQCIMTWRKTKDLGLDVVKTCPQCRVRSPFYMPNKYWVEGQAKERLITAFKEKCSKKSCTYYTRYRCCPFKTECLYRHDKHTRRRSFPYPAAEEEDDDFDSIDLLNFFIAFMGDGDDDDDYNFSFYLADEFGFL